jgi:hypothetical protein
MSSGGAPRERVDPKSSALGAGGFDTRSNPPHAASGDDRRGGTSSAGAVGWGGSLALPLRDHDLDFQSRQITVRHGKGAKDRRTMLSSRLAEKLQCYLEVVRRVIAITWNPA